MYASCCTAQDRCEATLNSVACAQASPGLVLLYRTRRSLAEVDQEESVPAHKPVYDLRDAVTYARSVEQPQQLRYRALEIASLHDHPRIQWWMDHKRKYGTYRYSNSPWIVALALLAADLVLAYRPASLFGVSVQITDTIAGVLFTASAAVQARFFKRRPGRHALLEVRAQRRWLMWNFLLAAVALSRMLTRPEPPSSWWIPIAASMVLSAAAWLITGVQARRLLEHERSIEGLYTDRPMGVPLHMIADLSQAEREAVKAELHAGLSVWHQRGWLSDDELEEALSVPLGELALRLPPPAAAR